MNFSAYSIRNPLVAIILFALLTVAGIIGFNRMKIQQFPDMDLPVVVVTVLMPGASPEQLETDIARIVEDRVSSIEGLKNTFTTVQTGVVTLINEFRLGVDIQAALDDVRSAVSEIQGQLPANAESPIIAKVNTAGLPIEIYTISSDSMDVEQLSYYVDNTVVRMLSSIDGIGSISRFGGVDRQINVDVDPYALQAAGATVANLSSELAYVQQDAPGGRAEIGSLKQSIRVLGNVHGVEDIAQLQLSIGNGHTVMLGNIADVRDGYAEQTQKAFLNGNPVVAFEVTRGKGASEVEVASRVREILAKIEAQNSKIHFDNVYDLAKPVADDYDSSIRMLIEGAILAVVVVFIFLRNIRATIIAAVALPLSIIPTFAGMYLLGFSLNIISLLALSLVVGVLVDDAIVEIENIIRHLRMGKTPYQAAMEAADEIGLAVIATTFTLIAVFLPTAFMDGVVGQFFKQFGWTASIAIFASLLVARLLTPMMAAYIIRPEKYIERPDSWVMRWYLKIADFAIRHRWLTLITTLALFASSLFLTNFIPKDFLPADDFSQTRVVVELPPGSTMEDTQTVSEQVRQEIIKNPAVLNVYSSLGKSHAGFERGVDSVTQAALNVVLKPKGERPSKQTIENDLRKRLENIPGARFRVGLSNGGEGGYQVSLVSDDWLLLKQTAHKVMQEIRDLPDVANVRSNEGVATEELQIIPDTLAMAQNGVTTAALAHTIRVATIGDYDKLLAKLNLDTRQIPVLVRLLPEYRGDIATLENLIILGAKGPVRLGDVAQIQFGSGASAINRYNRSREIKITVEGSAKELGSLIATVRNTPTIQNLPAGVRAVEQGQAEGMQELFVGFITAMSVGVLCIFGVLVLLFHRVLQPFTILMALPLSIGGAFIALLIIGSSLSMPSLIGLVMLMGIATKNSILLVDYAILAEQQGQSRLEALLDACHKRARPIIMTTIAMGAGMLPLILGLGGGDNSFRSPMATAVFGGLITSTMLSLIVIPTFYTFMDDLSRWFKRRISGRHQTV